MQPGSEQQSFYSTRCSADGSEPSCTTAQPLPVTSQPSPGLHVKPCKEPELVLIAELTSRQEIKLRIKQNDDIPGAKVCWLLLSSDLFVFMLLQFVKLSK